MMAVAAVCALPTMAESGDSLVFETVIANPVTSIKNQNNSGTCWSYSSLAFLESEAMKKNPKIKDLDLCESFLVSKTYVDRADRNVRTHGDASFSQGGSFYDAIYCMANYGLIPEGNMPYPNTLYGDSLFNFTSFFPPMEAYIKAIAKSDAKKISNAWKTGMQGILDAYLGKCPEKFTYEGKEYTPKSFAASLGINLNDYVSITSFTHHPFYTAFAVEVQDNWRFPLSYNLPMDEMMQIIDNAINQGYTIAWGGDVSEDGFTRKGLAYAIDSKATQSLQGSDMAKWLKMTASKKRDVIDSLGCTVPEIVATQELRQERFDNWELTDDHGMLIYGVAKDQNGKEYYMVKNSWGESGDYKGTWYMTKTFIAANTMDFLINKNAIPAEIRKKLGI